LAALWGIDRNDVRPILSERDHNAAIDRILELMDAEDRCETEDRELDFLVDYVDAYEDRFYPMGAPPIGKFQFCRRIVSI